jgi:hypothetical protein
MRPAREWSCPFTGEPADQLHHPTGRGADGKYLDQELVVPFILDQHVIEHQAWDRTKIGEDIVANPNWLRLRRTGQLLVRLGEFHGEGTVSLPSPFVRQLGFLLLRVAAEILLIDGKS